MTETGTIKPNIKRFAFSRKLGTSSPKNNELPHSVKENLDFIKAQKESTKQNDLKAFITEKSNLLKSTVKKSTENANDSELLSIVSHRTAGLVNNSMPTSSPRLSNLLKKYSSSTSSSSSKSNGYRSNQFFKNSSQESYKPLAIIKEKPAMITTNDDLDFDAVFGDDAPIRSSQNSRSTAQEQHGTVTTIPSSSRLSLIKSSHSQPTKLEFSPSSSDLLPTNTIPSSTSSTISSTTSQPLSISDDSAPRKRFKFGRAKETFSVLIPFHELSNSTRPINSVSSTSTITSSTATTSTSVKKSPSKSISTLELPKIEYDILPKVLAMPRPIETPQDKEKLEEQERFFLSNIDWDDEDEVHWDTGNDIDKTILDSPPRKNSSGRNDVNGAAAGNFFSADDYVDDDFDFTQLGVLDSPPRNAKSHSTENRKSEDRIDWSSFNDEFICDKNSGGNNTALDDALLNDSLACASGGAQRFIPIDKDAKSRKDDTLAFQREYPHSLLLREILHEKFGLKQFRPNQQEIINATLEQHDCFVLMPTGGGKSLCYQLPAILTPGVTIVISPLRALITDQVNKLNSLDIPAAHMCSDITRAKYNEIMCLLTQLEPPIKLLYLTPEKIVGSKQVYDTLVGLYSRGKLSRIVLDEAHCLSQWGHDFRPDYKQLKTLKVNFPKTPIMCLTATATHVVQQDVTNTLKLKQVKIFIRSFNRSNIKYQVLEKKKAIATDEIVKLIKQNFRRMSGIVYCLVRKDCDTLALDLRRDGIKAKAYHAGLSDKDREQAQSQWMNNEHHVICATIAFGMGIDKPDVRFVIHNAIPKSIEAFYQESGRAGRDGETAYSYLFYAYSDVVRLQKIIRMDKSIQRRNLEGHFDQVQQMAQYCENRTDCRRYLQLQHLGEKFNRQLCIKDKRTICDNCANFGTVNIHNVSKECKELATLVKDIGANRNFTLLHFVDVYKGSKAKRILDFRHNTHKYYGAGAHLDKTDIQRILKELSFKKVLVDVCQYNGEFPVIYVKPGPNYSHVFQSDVIISIPLKRKDRQPIPVSTSKPDIPQEVIQPEKETAPVRKTKTNKPAAIPQKTPISPSKTPEMRIYSLKIKCHEELLEKCAEFAALHHSNLSSIMNLSALKAMSEELPSTAQDFLKLQYVTKANFEKFGKDFLRITQKHRVEMDKIEAESALTDLNMDVLADDWDMGPNTSSGSAGNSSGGKKRRLNIYKRGWHGKKKTMKRF